MTTSIKAEVEQPAVLRSASMRSMKGMLALGAISVLMVAGYWATNVATRLTADDVVAVGRLGIDGACHGANGHFTRELACVDALQRAQLVMIPEHKCVPEHMSHEPLSAMDYGYACCFTRSRLIEKALVHYGYIVRHVSMHVLRAPIIGYLMLANSHAASEVRTSRGWMLVGSMQHFRAVTRKGKPLTAVQLRYLPSFSGLDRPLEDDSFYRQPYTTVYGLYSRHGQFYPPYVPLPDIAWSQIGYNFE